MANFNNLQEKGHWLYSMHARPSSAVLILEDAEGKVLIVKANYKSHWALPGGMIDADETPKQAAIREVSEEVGLIINPEDVTFGWIVARHSAVADTYQFIFKAPLHSDMKQSIMLQESEIDEWRLVSKAEVLSNNIHYAKTITLWANDNTYGYVEQTLDTNK